MAPDRAGPGQREPAFLTERVFAVLPWKQAGQAAVKPFWLRLVEVLVFYLVVGALGFAFESTLGNRFSQTWGSTPSR